MLLVVAMVGALVVGSGVALVATITCTTFICEGTPDNDLLTGTNQIEQIEALAGDDVVNAHGGSDNVTGDEGNDVVDGYGGIDWIYGGPDGDGSAEGTSFDSLNLEGGEDSEAVYGDEGNDIIDAAANDYPGQYPTEPVDYSYGGAGNDRINAQDGYVDYIYCGTGKRDVAIFDKGIDIPKGCEKKITDQV